MKDATGSVQSVLVLGGGSDIARAALRRLVTGRTRTVILAARKPERLLPEAEELRRRGVAEVALEEFDAGEFERHGDFVRDVFDRYGDIDLVLVAFGVLGGQESAERDSSQAVRVLHTNFVGAVSVLLPLAARLREQGHGLVVVLSSVAGERARKSNFVYGSSKAGLDAFCQGLGDRLAGSGVHVMVVRPGFVRTKMTTGLRPAPLAASADDVARAVADGLRRGADVVWVPATLRWVMSALRHAPRPLFRRLEI